jgi:hypothetical protein
MGSASSQELKSCLKSMSDNTQPTPEQLSNVWDRYDANKDGNMDSSEMATLMIALTELQKSEVSASIDKQAKDMGTCLAPPHLFILLSLALACRVATLASLCL